MKIKQVVMLAGENGVIAPSSGLEQLGLQLCSFSPQDQEDIYWSMIRNMHDLRGSALIRGLARAARSYCITQTAPRYWRRSEGGRALGGQSPEQGAIQVSAGGCPEAG